MYLQGLEYKQYRSRIHWIDIARCLSIAIIVYAHIYDVSGISDFVHVFHVPVFFVLSGLVWKQAKDLKVLLRSLFINLVIPFFIVGVLSIIAYQIMGSLFTADKLSFMQCLQGLFYANSRTGLMKWNRPLWFIPCLIVTRILWELISKLKKECAQYLVVAAIVVIGAIVVNTSLANYKLPWEIEVSIHALLYFAIGVAVKQHTSICSTDFASSVSRILLVVVIVISFGVCLAVFHFNLQPISFQYNHYGIYPLFVLGALSGTILVGGDIVAHRKEQDTRSYWSKYAGHIAMA